MVAFLNSNLSQGVEAPLLSAGTYVSTYIAFPESAKSKAVVVTFDYFSKT